MCLPIWFFCNLVEKDMLHHHFVFQQFNTSSSVHQSLHGFQFVDIPFRYAICNAEFDSVPVCSIVRLILFILLFTISD